MSSYLFIIRQEILSRMLDHELRLKNTSGIKTSISDPIITHAMYVNDIVLFTKASRKDATNLVKVLDKYCSWFGQAINRKKSRVFFSKHTQNHTKRTIKGLLQVKNLKNDAIYLGAPMFLSRATSKDFAFRQDKLEAKLMGWRSKCLSWASRKTLINSIAQIIPIYTMSTFSIPNKVCNKLDSITRRFWWKSKQHEGRFLASKAWDNLCCPTKEGGLGFKKVKDINSALLAKLGWMVVSKRDSLCMSILRSKYKVKDDWLRSDISKQASPIWKAIEKSKGIISKGVYYLIGDGSSMEVWLDPWVPGIQGFIQSSRTASPAPPPMKVSYLIDPELHCWKAPLIWDLFTQANAQAILSIPTPIRPRLNRMVWIPESNGCFSVKAAYKEMASHNPPLLATNIKLELTLETQSS